MCLRARSVTRAGRARSGRGSWGSRSRGSRGSRTRAGPGRARRARGLRAPSSAGPIKAARPAGQGLLCQSSAPCGQRPSPAAHGDPSQVPPRRAGRRQRVREAGRALGPAHPAGSGVRALPAGAGRARHIPSHPSHPFPSRRPARGGSGAAGGRGSRSERRCRGALVPRAAAQVGAALAGGGALRAAGDGVSLHGRASPPFLRTVRPCRPLAEC